MQKDMKQIDFRNSVSDLINSGKIKEVSIKGQGQAYIYILNKDDPIEGALAELAEGE